MENVKALYILLLFAAFSVPLVIFFCLCVYCGLTTRRRSNKNRILYSIATQDYFQHIHPHPGEYPREYPGIIPGTQNQKPPHSASFKYRYSLSLSPSPSPSPPPPPTTSPPPLSPYSPFHDRGHKSQGTPGDESTTKEHSQP